MGEGRDNYLLQLRLRLQPSTIPSPSCSDGRNGSCPHDPPNLLLLRRRRHLFLPYRWITFITLHIAVSFSFSLRGRVDESSKSRRDRSEPKMHSLGKKHAKPSDLPIPQHQTDQGFRARTPSMQHQKHAASSLLAPSSSSSLQLVRCFSFYVRTSIPSFPYSRLYSNSRQMMMRSRCGKATVCCCDLQWRDR
jgi:hypothetical protein